MMKIVQNIVQLRHFVFLLARFALMARYAMVSSSSIASALEMGFRSF